MSETKPLIREATPDFTWEATEVLAYKEEGQVPFKAITRQVLFAEPTLGCELRYFEMKAGGYSTLERHEHAHAVMILRGHGTCLIGAGVWTVKPRDLVSVPPLAWHQFRASRGTPMGFLCMVNAQRDKPQLPTADEIKALKADARVAAFLDGRPS